MDSAIMIFDIAAIGVDIALLGIVVFTGRRASQKVVVALLASLILVLVSLVLYSL